MDPYTPFSFLIASLATWRAAALLVREDGPFDVVARARRVLRHRLHIRALECFYCTSLWVAAPLAYWMVGAVWRAPVVWFAVSGAAGILERLTLARSPEQIFELDEAAGLVAQGRG